MMIVVVRMLLLLLMLMKTMVLMLMITLTRCCVWCVERRLDNGVSSMPVARPTVLVLAGSGRTKKIWCEI